MCERPRNARVTRPQASCAWRWCSTASGLRGCAERQWPRHGLLQNLIRESLGAEYPPNTAPHCSQTLVGRMRLDSRSIAEQLLEQNRDGLTCPRGTYSAEQRTQTFILPTVSRLATQRRAAARLRRRRCALASRDISGRWRIRSQRRARSRTLRTRRSHPSPESIQICSEYIESSSGSSIA